jgi:hypothetical protein
VLQTRVGAGTWTSYLYDHERLASRAAPRTWYLTDALGTVRRTISDADAIQGTASYSAWGEPQSGFIAPFGFTGELQSGAVAHAEGAHARMRQRAALIGSDPARVSGRAMATGAAGGTRPPWGFQRGATPLARSRGAQPLARCGARSATLVPPAGLAPWVAAGRGVARAAPHSIPP